MCIRDSGYPLHDIYGFINHKHQGCLLTGEWKVYELSLIHICHLMGEYFSPDWIVEHALDLVGYKGDIEKTLSDPTAGAGTRCV